MGEETPCLQSKPQAAPTFPPLAGDGGLGIVAHMSDDDYTPDDSGDSDSSSHHEGCDHDHADGTFYEEQHAWDRIDLETREARRGSCLLLLLAWPAGAWLLFGW